MRQLEEAFEHCDSFYLTYPSEREDGLPRFYTVSNFAKKPWALPLVFFKMLQILIQERPVVVLSTGSEIAIPLFVLAKLLGIRTIYVESSARVVTPSLTGKLVYPLSDYFFVQWDVLRSCYGKKARYQGGLL